MLLEREGELRRLVDLVDGVADGGGRVVLVRGHAGVGKTSLVSEFLSEVADRSHVLFGNCDDLITPQPLAPFWDMARDEPQLRSGLDAGDVRAVMEAAMELMTRRLRPTVVAIDDMQWADEATLDVARYLGRRIGRTSGLLVLTYRDGELDEDHPLRQVIGQLPPRHVERISLAPLSEAAVGLLLAGSGLDVSQVMTLTGGNPLFVSETLEWGMGDVPPSVNDSVLARVARLSPDVRSIIETVAMFPGDAPRQLVDELVGSAVDECRECASFLDVEGDLVRFKHQLTRHVVESSIDSAERRDLNQRILAAIVPDAEPAVIVHHARQAADADVLIEYGPRAARDAMALGSNTEALAHLRALEPLLDRLPPSVAGDLLFDMARCERELGERRTGTLDRAIDLYRSGGAPDALGRALTFAIRVDLEAGSESVAASRAAEAVALLERSGPTPDLAWALGQKAALLMLTGQFDEADEVAEAAIRVAREVRDERSEIDVSITRAGISIMHGVDALDELEDCRRRADEAGFADLEIRALINLAMNAGHFRGTDQAVDLCLRCRAAAHRWEALGVEALATTLLGTALCNSGDWAEAERSLLEVIEADLDLTGSARTTLCLIQARSGLPAAEATLRDAIDLVNANPLPQHLMDLAVAAAEFAWLTGNDDETWVAVAERGRAVAEELDFSPGRSSAIAFWMARLGTDVMSEEVHDAGHRLMIQGDSGKAARIWEQRGYPYERGLALMDGDDEQRLEALAIFDELGAVPVADRVRWDLRSRGVTVPRRRARPRKRVTELTERQSEVLALLVEGLTSPEIADRLFLSKRTVESHVAAIFTRLGVGNRRDAARVARERSLVG